MQKAPQKRHRKKTRAKNNESPFQFQLFVGIGLSCSSSTPTTTSRRQSEPSPHMSLSPASTSKELEIRLDGSDPERMLRHLRLFHEVGCQFRAGVSSFRAIARVLDTLDVAGKLQGMNASVSALRRMRIAIEEYCGTQLNLVDLFATQGIGHGFHDLTESGWNAWRLVRDYLVKAGLLHESLDKY